MIRNGVFTGTVSASTPLSLNFKFITNKNLNLVDNGDDAETVPVNTSFLIINKDAFLWRCKLGKTIISIRTVYHYAPPNYSSHEAFIEIRIAKVF